MLHRETNGSWKWCGAALFFHPFLAVLVIVFGSRLQVELQVFVSGPEVEAWNRPNWCILGVSLCEFFAEVDAKGIQKSPDVTASESTDIGTNGYIVICGMDELNRVE